MRLTGSRTYYRPSPPKMPPGLVELMEGLTKEVLKQNPSQIYGFCANHMQQLLEKRDGPFTKKPLSLEEKICRAQEKVRQRAEKRRNEFDMKKCLERESTVNENNDDMMSQIPKITTEPPSNVVNSNVLNSSLQDQNGGNVLENLVSTKESGINICIQESNKELANLKVHENKEYVDLTVTAINRNPYDVSAPTTNVDPLMDKKLDDDMLLDSITLKDDQHFENTSNLETAPGDGQDRQITITNIQPLLITASKQTPDNYVNNENIEKSINDLSVPLTDSKQIPNTEKSIEKTEMAAIENVQDRPDYSNFSELTNDSEITGSEMTEIRHVSDIEISKNEEPTNEIEKNDKDRQTTQTVKCNDDMIQVFAGDNDALNAHMSPRTKDGEQECDSKDQDCFLSSSQNTDNKDLSDTSAEIAFLSNSNNIQESFLGKTNTSKDDQEDKTPEVVQSNVISSGTDVLNTNIDIDAKEAIGNEHELISDSDQNIIHMDTKLSTADMKLGTRDELTMPNRDSELLSLDLENTTNSGSQEKKDSDMSFPELKNEIPHDENSIALKGIMSSNTEDNRNKLESECSTVSNSDKENDYNSQDDIANNMNDNNLNKNLAAANMDLETAAVTIQKVFRSYLFRSRGSTFEDKSPNNDDFFFDVDTSDKDDCDFPIPSTIDRRTHGITRMDTVLQTVNEEKSLSLSTEDSSTLSSAATTIQAHVRGFLVRNRLNSNKTVSTNSLPAGYSNEPLITSFEADNQNRSKTVLNIHIVPEGGDYLSRDESLITSMDLSLDSPLSSINLHPLNNDKSDRRRRLKREDAIQSVSPPSNNSGKLSDDLDTGKETIDHEIVADSLIIHRSPSQFNLDKEHSKGNSTENGSVQSTKFNEESVNVIENHVSDADNHLKHKRKSLTKMNSDERDVVTPLISNDNSGLMHSGEFHDAVLPTKVLRSDTSVVSGE